MAMALSQRCRTVLSSTSSLLLRRPFSTATTEHFLTHDVTSQTGSCMPLSLMRIGTIIHNLEIRPGQGSKLVRSAGTSAKILKIPSPLRCLVRLPSGSQKLLDSRCRATIGTVSNLSHYSRKLHKAGNNRWRGWRPTVRGVAMNPVDHPHGGGEGKSKGNHSMTPWGKPTKGGYKTASPRKRNSYHLIPFDFEIQHSITTHCKVNCFFFGCVLLHSVYFGWELSSSS